LCLILVFISASDLQAKDPTASIHILHSRDKYPAGGTHPILFEITIAQGWKIHGTRESDEGLIPTRLTLEPLPGINFTGPEFPKPQRIKFDYTTEEIEVYADTMLVKTWLGIDASHPAGEVRLKGQLSYQACTDAVCLPPENLAFDFPIAVVGAGAATTPLNTELFETAKTDRKSGSALGPKGFGVGFWLTLLGIFLGGLALNLTPCIYPLIPITVSYFGGKSNRIQGRNVLHAALYLAGLALTNSLLGLAAALSGGMLGAVLQNPVVLILLAAIMLALALSFFGVWELRAPGFLTNIASKNYKGYFGTFFMGLTLGIVAAPCLGPFILGLVTYVGQTGDPLLGFLYFLVLSIGMGLPLSILAIFSSALDRLPRSGEWMIWVKKAMGWILVGVAVYIVKPIVPPSLLKNGLLFLVMIMAGIHLGWLGRTGSQPKRFKSIKKYFGIVVVLAGIVLLVSAIQPKQRFGWQPYSPEAMTAAKITGKPVLLDFYADWCLPCKELEHQTFSDSRVIALGQQFTRLRVDLTRRQPYQDKLLRQYQVRGVPTVIFINPDGIELTDLRVEAFIKADDFIKRMQSALEKSAQ